jgi:hypothetical protein
MCSAVRPFAAKLQLMRAPNPTNTSYNLVRVRALPKVACVPGACRVNFRSPKLSQEQFKAICTLQNTRKTSSSEVDLQSQLQLTRTIDHPSD